MGSGVGMLGRGVVVGSTSVTLEALNSVRVGMTSTLLLKMVVSGSMGEDMLGCCGSIDRDGI